jgi:hypothetical protein
VVPVAATIATVKMIKPTTTKDAGRNDKKRCFLLPFFFARFLDLSLSINFSSPNYRIIFWRSVETRESIAGKDDRKMTNKRKHLSAHDCVGFAWFV